METELGFERLTVKVATTGPALPSATATSSMLMEGTASSSWIVPRPWASRMEAPPTGFVRFTKYVSSGSSMKSPSTGTFRKPTSDPAGMVTVPVVVV